MSAPRYSKRGHAIAVRDAVVAAVLAHGRPGYNVMLNGQLTRIATLERGRVSVEYLAPRWPVAGDPGEHSLVVRHDGETVLRIEWQGERIQVKKFEPGRWEALLGG